MSEPEQKIEIAGHAPATIVGGMRVAQNKNHLHHTAKTNGAEAPNVEKTEKEIDEKVATSEEPNKTEEPKTVPKSEEEPKKRHTVSGNTLVDENLSIKLKDAFPAQAVKHFHEKPGPTLAPYFVTQPVNCIFQPRKFNIH